MARKVALGVLVSPVELHALITSEINALLPQRLALIWTQQNPSVRFPKNGGEIKISITVDVMAQIVDDLSASIARKLETLGISMEA